MAEVIFMIGKMSKEVTFFWKWCSQVLYLYIILDNTSKEMIRVLCGKILEIIGVAK